MTAVPNAAGRHPAIQDVCQYFEYEHLPTTLRATSEIFAHAAFDLLAEVTYDSPQVTIALQLLLVAKDAAVRSRLAQVNEDRGAPAGMPI